MTYLAAHPLLTNPQPAVILLSWERSMEGVTKGTFTALGREEVAHDSSTLRGVRANAVIVLDETLGQQWLEEVAKPLLVAGTLHTRRQQPLGVFNRPAMDNAGRDLT